MPVRESALEELEGTGSRLTGSTGGLPRQRYWTPDGREIRAIPSIRIYIDRSVDPPAEGIRDANLDKGWLLQKPTRLKRYCPHCDYWHNTQKQIDACGQKKKAFQDKYTRKAKRDLAKSNGSDEERLDKLEKLIEKMAASITLMQQNPQHQELATKVNALVEKEVVVPYIKLKKKADKKKGVK